MVVEIKLTTTTKNKDAIQKEKASCDTIHKAKLATVKEYLFLLLLLLLFVVVIVSCLLLFLICCCCCVVVLTLLYNECVLVCFSFLAKTLGEYNVKREKIKKKNYKSTMG